MMGPLASHRPHRAQAPARGLTLIELMVVVVVLGVLVALVGPSFSEMITMQRLRGTNAQLVTDMQFARSEAVSRGRIAKVNFGSDSLQTCYVIFTAPGYSSGDRCKCEASPVCPGNAQEIRTVRVERSSKVTLSLPDATDSAFGFDPVTGGLVGLPTDKNETPPISVTLEAKVDTDRRLRTTILETGRPTVCAPNAAVMGVIGC